jgi:hypothetical protein
MRPNPVVYEANKNQRYSFNEEAPVVCAKLKFGVSPKGVKTITWKGWTYNLMRESRTGFHWYCPKKIYGKRCPAIAVSQRLLDGSFSVQTKRSHAHM